MIPGPVWQDERVADGMRAQLALRARRLEEGGRPLGWKVGFGVPAQYEPRGLSGPVVGFLMENAFSRGEPLAIGAWTVPVLEPEIAVHLARDVEPGADRDAVIEAIAGIGPAFEIVDFDPSMTEVRDVVATNVFQRGVLLGDMAATDVAAAADVQLTLWRDGEEVASEADPVGAVGDLVDHVRHAAELLGAAGARLSAGEVLITGAIVVGIRVAPGETWRGDFGPLGELTASFTA
jgi:2-keto-4-pentenoate hydratase